MKNKLFYFLLLLLSLGLPVFFLRSPLTGAAFLVTLIAIYGAGQAFHNAVFPNPSFEINSFGLGFILLSGIAFTTAFFSISAVFFTLFYLAATGYGIYRLINYLYSGSSIQINVFIVIIILLILGFNLYPTLLIQGYEHHGSISWVNNDATVYTSIVNRVKMETYPITIPGYGIEKLYYHYGMYAFAGYVARIFHLSATDSLFGIIRGLAIVAVIFSIISLAASTHNRQKITYRVAGALIGFFLIGSLTAIFEYMPFHFPRIDHGMKHLRGFLIGHSSLWIFTALIPVIALINYKVVHKVKFNLVKILLVAALISFTASLNFIAAPICICLMGFFILLYPQKEESRFVQKRNILFILSPFIFLLIGIAIYLYKSEQSIQTSLFFLPIFDLGTWSNFLTIFFLLYIGIRVFGLNYLISKTERHLGYMQFIILLAACSFMLLLGFFVEPMAGRENDIKYGFVLIQGTLGLFSGLWLGEKLGSIYESKERMIAIRLKNGLFPFILLFSLVFCIAFTGFINSRIAKELVQPFARPVIIALGIVIASVLIMRFKKSIYVNRKFLLIISACFILLSLPGVLHEFNKYRSVETNEEKVSLKSEELKLIQDINNLNKKNKLLLLALQKHESESFATSYKFNALINAPVLNEGANYFGVKKKEKFLSMEKQLDSFYANKDISILKNMSDEYGISFYVFDKTILSDSVFTNKKEFALTDADSMHAYIVEYSPKK